MYAYSFQAISGAIQNAALGQYEFQGQIGIKEFHVIMNTDRSALETAADGAIMGSAMAGRSGVIEMMMLQSSSLHAWVENLFNILEQAELNGDVTNWFGMNITIIDQLTGRQHVGTGGALVKIPDQPYAAQGQSVTWRFLFADIATSVPLPS